MKRICYLVGDINYHGGAQFATAMLLKALCASGYKIDILTNENPDREARKRFDGCTIKVHEYPTRGFRWLVKRVLEKFLGWYVMPLWIHDPTRKLRRWLRTFDIVCIMSEGSQWRRLVSYLPGNVRKVQMIHTDYCFWHKTTQETMHDDHWYGRMNCIAVVGRPNAEKMKSAMPHLADKIVPFHNILKAIMRVEVPRSCGDIVNLVTLSRLEVGGAKCVDKMIRVAARLKADGVKIVWTVYGDGDRERLDALAKDLDVCDVFRMPGYTPNPHVELAKADLSVMLSAYEGASNGIYESMMLGVPVFSTNVGAAEEQIQDGVNGWLVEDDEDKIFEKLKTILLNRNRIESAREALKDYHYDNDAALAEHIEILGLEENA